MNDHIENIYKNNVELIGMTDKIIYYFYTQNYDTAFRMTTSVINKMNSYMEVLLSSTSFFNEENQIAKQQEIISILNTLLDAIENKDYILIADIFELQFIPFLIHLQETIIFNEDPVIDHNRYEGNMLLIKKQNEFLLVGQELTPKLTDILDSGYSVEFTSCGLTTLACMDNGRRYYLHSNNRIQNEAFLLANSWYSEDITEYIIYGLGFGYHILALVELDTNIIIKVFESDINVIKLACAFSDLQILLTNPNVQVIYDPEFKLLYQQIQKINDEGKFLIHSPSLRNIKDYDNRKKLENYFMQYSSIENQRKLLNGNFRENIHHYDALVDELKDDFKGKDLFIIAAGPSLDTNFLQLKSINKDKAIILATGTVFRKLLNSGITPDHLIVTDANLRVYYQIAGLENSSIPMLYLSTANKSFAQNYKGNKYMILQKDYDKAENFAKAKNAMLFQTGGSVSTTALDVGITFGCKRIIFLGLDLAFTYNYVHATDTSRRNLTTTEDLRQVEDIHGNLIYTSKSLDIYRHWIENRIRDVKDIEFIDATEGGAKIEGMKIMKLADTLITY